jgi:hypothetical protein
MMEGLRLALILNVVALSVARAAPPPEAYPSTSDLEHAYLMTIKFDYEDSHSFEGTPATLENGYFRLPNGVGGGGWIHISTTLHTPPPCGLVATSTVKYRIQLAKGVLWSQRVPAAVEQKIHVESQIALTPHKVGASGLTPRNWPYHTTLDILEPSGPFGREFVFEPFSDIAWLDQDVALQVKVWLDPDIAVVGGPDNAWLAPLLKLRTVETNPTQVVSPLMVPIAIIYKPPGDKSWSKMTVTDNSGATLATTTTNTTSMSSQEKFGFQGTPFYYQGPQLQTKKISAAGITQNWNAKQVFSVTNNKPGGPGRGDLFIAVTRPALGIFRGSAGDEDFQLLCGAGVACAGLVADQCVAQVSMDPNPNRSDRNGAIAVFSVEDLTAPSPGSPWAALKPIESAALRALDPLAGNPTATLALPRYAYVTTYEVQTSGSQTCQEQDNGHTHVVSATDTQSTSETSDPDAFSLSIQFGAIAGQSLKASGILSGAVASVLPGIFTDRTDETVTTSVEYKTEGTNAVGGDVSTQFCLDGSHAGKTLCTQVFYDLFFHTFAFSDCSPAAEVGASVLRAAGSGPFTGPAAERWIARPVPGTRDFAIAGSLGPAGAGARTAEITRAGQAQVIRVVEVAAGTGNLVLSGIPTGDYVLRSNGNVSSLRVGTDGVVALKPVAFALVNVNSGRCLDVTGGGAADGVPVQQFGCHGGDDQAWQMKNGTLVNVHSGKCLDVPGSSAEDHARIQQFSCNGGTNQSWQITRAGSVVNTSSKRCLDVADGSLDDHAVVQQFACHGTANQRWTLRPR